MDFWEDPRITRLEEIQTDLETISINKLLEEPDFFKDMSAKIHDARVSIEAIKIEVSKMMAKPVDCFGNAIESDDLRFILFGDESKIIHTAMCIALHPLDGYWIYVCENGEMHPCSNAYNPDRALSMIESELVDSIEDESVRRETAKRIFAKFPK